MAITAYQTIQCAAVPTDDADLTNKLYVDTAVANAGGGSSGGETDHLKDSQSANYYYIPTLIGLAGTKYLVGQETVASEYSSSKTYQVGDICTYQGHLWKRINASGSGVTPMYGGTLWTQVTVESLIPRSQGCDLGEVNYTPGSGVNLSNYPGVVKVASTYSSTLGTLGIDLGGITVGGMLSLELHIDCSNSTPSSLPIKWQGASLATTWVGSGTGVVGLISGKVNIVKLRMFPGEGKATLELIGGY